MALAVPVPLYRELFRRTYEYHFPLSDETIVDIVKTKPISLQGEEEVQQYILNEMVTRAKMFGRGVYAGRGLL
jgi:hypothetical protein